MNGASKVPQVCKNPVSLTSCTLFNTNANVCPEKSEVLACVMRNYDHQDLARIFDKVSGELYTTNCFTIVDRLFAIGKSQSNKSQGILSTVQNREIVTSLLMTPC